MNLHTRAVCLLAAAPMIFIAAFSPAGADGRAPEIYMDQGGFFAAPWRYGVDGYDVVAYFSLLENAAPVAGLDAYVTDYKGVSWRFSSQENLDAFTAAPDRYRPQYGGYCAWAVAGNKLAKGAPRHWHIHDGKLYLNVSAGIKRKWLKDLENFLARSEQNWPGVLEQDN